MKIKSENEILDPAVRKKIIEEILGSENHARKAEARKRYLVDKDMTNLYVEQMLLKQFDAMTVEEMKYSIANVSICRKIIDKKARVYSPGVQRIMPDDLRSTVLKDLADKLEADTKMKKADRFLELFKNCKLYVKPKPEEDGKYCLKILALAPFLYDVVENYYDREEDLCVILSDFDENSAPLHSLNPAQEGRNFTTSGLSKTKLGDGIDQAIADTPGDGKKEEFIWWSKNYHFTTDKNGKIISGPEQENPIKELPFVNIAKDQDGHFWAQGGGDLIDGCILVNSMISNINHIGVTQGYGQPVMTGSNLPQRVKVGPNFLIKLEAKEGESADFKFVSANPQIKELQDMVTMYVALLLSTNNLSVSSVKASLDGGSDFASGIALMVDKSESVESIQDQVKIFVEAEKELWDIVFKWLNLYNSKSLLEEDLVPYVLPDVEELQVKFNDQKPIITEKEKLEAMKLRQELGISTKLDLIMMDNPDMSAEEAMEKMKEIMKEKMERMAQFSATQPTMMDGEEMESEDEGQGSNGGGEGDVLNSGLIV